MPDTTDRLRVDTRDPLIIADEALHKLPRALRAGTTAMRELGEEYNRPLVGERTLVPVGGTVGDADYTIYDLRIGQAVLNDVWAATIENTAARPFRRKIQVEGFDVQLTGVTLTDEAGTETGRVPGWVDNIDGEGQTLDAWAQGAFLDATFEGVVYAFTDMESRTFTSLGSRRSSSVRPFVTLLKRSDLVWMIVENSDAGKRLAAIAFYQPMIRSDWSNPDERVREVTPAIKVVTAGWVEEGEDGSKTVVPVRTQTWVEIDSRDAKGKGEVGFVHDPELDDDITPPRAEDAESLLDIPLVPLYGERVGPFRGRSPYLRTAPAAASIWREGSLADSKAMETALAYLHETGVKPQKAERKGRGDGVLVTLQTVFARYRSSPDPTARLTWAEQDPAVLEALDKRVAAKVASLAKTHRDLDADRTSGPVTATEINLTAVYARGDLEARVILHEAAWTMILTHMAILGGHAQRGRASIPHDFDLPTSDLDRLTTLYLADGMLASNYYSEMTRHAAIGEGFDVQAEVNFQVKRLEMAGQELVAQGLLDALEDVPAADEDKEDEEEVTPDQR